MVSWNREGKLSWEWDNHALSESEVKGSINEDFDFSSAQPYLLTRIRVTLFQKTEKTSYSAFG